VTRWTINLGQRAAQAPTVRQQVHPRSLEGKNGRPDHSSNLWLEVGRDAPEIAGVGLGLGAASPLGAAGARLEGRTLLGTGD